MLNYHALGKPEDQRNVMIILKHSFEDHDMDSTDSSDQSDMEVSDIEWMMPDQDSKDLCKPLRIHIVQNTDWYWLSTHEKQEIKTLVCKVQY